MNNVKEIKSTIAGYYEIKEEDGTLYKIKILGRGEELFFQKNDSALTCDISARFAVIDPLSIKRWDNGRKISEKEREVILIKVTELYEQAYQDKLEVLRTR